MAVMQCTRRAQVTTD